MGVLINQNDFTHGELDPRMLSRSDLSIYRKAATRLRNGLVIPKGGVRRRFGTMYVTDLGQINDQVIMTEFIFDEETTYLLVFTNLLLTIYKDDVVVKTIPTPWPGELLARNELRFSQTKNSMVLVNSDHIPRELTRTGDDDTDWSLSTINFKNLPAFDFDQNYDDVLFRLSDHQVGVDRELTSDINIFKTDHVGGIFITTGNELSDNVGVARITEYDTAKKVKVEIVSEFSEKVKNPGLKGKSCFLGEKAWSNIRGWPTSVTFYEGRLIFGGARSLPNTIFMSVVSDFRNFDIGTGQDDDAIQVEIGGHRIGIIKHVLGDKTLQIFSSRTEHTAPQLDGRALTPRTISMRNQSNNGIENVPPVVVDNQTFYVRRGGKGVMSFLFNDDQQSYNSTDVSLISSHLIVNPVDSAVLLGSTEDDANYMFLVNGDGTLAVYQTLVAENVSAWTLCETDNDTEGKFLRCSEVGDDIYFVVQRTVNGSVNSYLEKLSFTAYTDSAKQYSFGTPQTVITGLSHLEGEEVRVRGDGYVLLNKTVDGGQITLDDPRSEVEVGLNYDVVIRPMPIAIDSNAGNNMYIRKRINRVFVDYYESLGIYINNILVPYLEFGPDVLDQPPLTKTGISELNLMSDWEPRTFVEIEQLDPLPMTILGVGFEVTV